MNGKPPAVATLAHYLHTMLATVSFHSDGAEGASIRASKKCKWRPRKQITVERERKEKHIEEEK